MNMSRFKRCAMVAVPLGVVGSMLATGAAFATGGGTTYSVAPVTESITENIEANLPIILVVVGGLIALGVIITLVRKFAKPH